MAIPILSEIERLINERGSSTVLMQRLSLAADQYSALEKKLSDSELRAKNLESENNGLGLDLKKAEEKIRNLEERISHLAVPAEFVEEAGALFKKNADGSWNETPYCPSCKTAMASPRLGVVSYSVVVRSRAAS